MGCERISLHSTQMRFCLSITACHYIQIILRVMFPHTQLLLALGCHFFCSKKLIHFVSWMDLTIATYSKLLALSQDQNLYCNRQILFPSCHTSTSCMACTWTPQPLPCSTRAESKASIRMILRRPGVSLRSTLSRST